MKRRQDRICIRNICSPFRYPILKMMDRHKIIPQMITKEVITSIVVNKKHVCKRDHFRTETERELGDMQVYLY